MSGSVTRRNWKPTGAICTLRFVGMAGFDYLACIINIVHVNNDNIAKNFPAHFNSKGSSDR